MTVPHEMASHRFVHGAPGAVDCWDAVMKCRKCGREYVEVFGEDVRMTAYFRAFPRGTVRGHRDGRFVSKDLLEDCDLLVVRDVMQS